MKPLLIGSCLSAGICNAAGLKPDASYPHLRTDFILKALNIFDAQGVRVCVGSDVIGCAEKDVLPIYHQLASSLKDPRHKKMLMTRIRVQQSKKLHALRLMIKDATILVFDNNYDLWGHLYEIYFNKTTNIFSNLNLRPSLPSSGVGLFPILTADEIELLQLQLFTFILEINPLIRLFYFNYPVTAFEIRGSPTDLQRVQRARTVNAFMKRAITKGELSEQITFVGCIDLPHHLLSAKGPLYFEPEVYHTFAELIKQKTNPNSDLKARYFDNFIALQKQLGMSPSAGTSPAKHPYSVLPDRQYWKPAVSERYPLAITDLYRKKYAIAAQDAIATCGSCFAQHIGKRLREGGYHYLDLEPAPTDLKAEQAKASGYGLYSARYGNVYTSRQLLQLHQRAFGELSFTEAWLLPPPANTETRFVDPFRPNLCGEGYASPEAMLADQAEHLRQVRRMFETLDVFVFTMGLTETWYNRESGAVYPICPGVTAGTFDPGRHGFVNLDYATTLEEMEQFLARLKDCNPKARVLLTVSPVPLTATAEDRHVLLSTMASKSILRAVADRLYQLHEHVDYFPSYDIILSPPYKSMFFKNNLRSIHDEGVDYVMTHFFAQHRLDGAVGTIAGRAGAAGAIATCSAADKVEDGSEDDDEVFCDEAFLELDRQRTSHD